VYDTVGGAPSHVSLVVGDGTVIHAVSEGPRTGVIVSPVSDKYWSPRLIAARSFLPAAAASGGAPATAAPPASPAKPAAPSGKAAPSAGKTDKPASAAPAAKAAPSPQPQRAAQEAAVVDIGLTIPRVKATFTDKIPTAAGTGVAFTLTNGTGAEGSFMVLFFRIDPKTYKLGQIHEEKVKLAAKAAASLPPYRFAEAGKYRLVVKDSWGNPLLERTFMVTGAED
jgi:cell wall-associated NlpC family hydrolase